MIARAYAKINLALRVGARREDGYHDLETIFQTVSLYDELHITAAADLSLSVVGDETLSLDDNLVIRAAHALAREAGVPPRARIDLVKRIPAGGGLGGGSSDAATALLALDALWGTRATASDLHRLATTLGADVPYFLLGGTALGLGRGERLFALTELPERAVVLALPRVSVSTRDAFRGLLRAARRPDALSTWRHACMWTWKEGCFEGFENDFEETVFADHPRLHDLRVQLAGGGAELARMSGSGSTVFGLFRDPLAAEVAAAAIRAGGIHAELVTTVNRATIAREAVA